MKSKNKPLTEAYKYLTAEQRANNLLETIELNDPWRYLTNRSNRYTLDKEELERHLGKIFD
jgi:hypothetical protein